MKLEEQIEELKKQVEKVAYRKPSTPNDFEYLSEVILKKTRENISKTTLMRIWSYIKENSQTRISTLNILSRYLNFRDFEAFQEFLENNNEESQQVLNPLIRTDQLKIGQCIEIKWNPNKRMVVEYKRKDLFEVKISENSKVKIGSTFTCSQIIQGQPLHIFDLTYKDEFFDCYVIGQNHGITDMHICDEQI